MAAVAAKAGTPFGRELASVAPQAHPVAMEVRRLRSRRVRQAKEPRLLIRSRGIYRAGLRDHGRGLKTRRYAFTSDF